MKKIVAVAIVGLGGRGGEAYGRHIIDLKDKFKSRTFVISILRVYINKGNKSELLLAIV